MKVLCAWCGKILGGRGAATSHGICRRCFQDYFQVKFDFLESVPRQSPTPIGGVRAAPRRSRASGSEPMAELALFN